MNLDALSDEEKAIATRLYRNLEAEVMFLDDSRQVLIFGTILLKMGIRSLQTSASPEIVIGLLEQARLEIGANTSV